MEAIKMTGYQALVPLFLMLLWSHGSSKAVDKYTVRGGIIRSDLVCWTCPTHNDNESCNRWAPNLACPQNDTVCQTVHMFNTETKESLTVEKRCMKPLLCASDHVGCQSSDDGFTKICVSCCKESLCNEEVPMDEDSAMELSFDVLEQPGASQRAHSNRQIHIPVLTLLIAALFL